MTKLERRRLRTLQRRLDFLLDEQKVLRRLNSYANAEIAALQWVIEKVTQLDAERREMGASNYVHLEDCNIMKVTEKAVLIEFEDEQHWIPVSQLADGEDHNLEEGDKGLTVSVTEWIAKQKGIET